MHGTDSAFDEMRGVAGWKRKRTCHNSDPRADLRGKGLIENKDNEQWKAHFKAYHTRGFDSSSGKKIFVLDLGIAVFGELKENAAWLHCAKAMIKIIQKIRENRGVHYPLWQRRIRLQQIIFRFSRCFTLKLCNLLSTIQSIMRHIVAAVFLLVHWN